MARVWGYAIKFKKLKSNQAELNQTESLEQCKCENENILCPVNKQCMTNNVVYEAKVKTRYATKSYIGMTGRNFIDRWKEHRGNLRHKHQKGTKLSNYIWKQKEYGENIQIEDIEWNLRAKAVPYKPGARFCDTCLCEKTHTALSEPSEILNSRREIVNKCPHKRKFKLCFYKPP